MTDVPYHHGNLRAVLLAAAEQTLREGGIDEISLRDLARRSGVSKSAPNRHFRDRQALLAALAVRGFERLDDEIAQAVARAGDVCAARVRAAAGAFVAFAVRDGALLELMFTMAKTEGRSDVGTAAERVFTRLGALIEEGQSSGELRGGDTTRLKLLLAATLQGIATLVASGRVPAELTDDLIDDAVALFRG